MYIHQLYIQAINGLVILEAHYGGDGDAGDAQEIAGTPDVHRRWQLRVCCIPQGIGLWICQIVLKAYKTQEYYL